MISFTKEQIESIQKRAKQQEGNAEENFEEQYEEMFGPYIEPAKRLSAYCGEKVSFDLFFDAIDLDDKKAQLELAHKYDMAITDLVCEMEYYKDEESYLNIPFGDDPEPVITRENDDIEAVKTREKNNQRRVKELTQLSEAFEKERIDLLEKASSLYQYFDEYGFLNSEGREVFAFFKVQAISVVKALIEYGQMLLREDSIYFDPKKGNQCMLALFINFGITIAYYELGYSYLVGRGVTIDEEKAFRFFDACVSLNISEEMPNFLIHAFYKAKLLLSICYDKGIGIEENYDKAVELYSDVKNSKYSILPIFKNEIIKAWEDGRTKEIQSLLDSFALESEKIGIINSSEMIGMISELTNTNAHKKKLEIIRNLINEADKQTQALLKFYEDETRNAISKAEKEKHTYQNFEENLKERFGDNWLKLDDYTRRSMITAEVVLGLLINEDIDEKMDYSAVCIAATTALENELKIRFFDRYKEYLGDEVTNWPVSILKYNGKRNIYEDKLFFTLGVLPYIFGARLDKNWYAYEAQEVKEKISAYLRSCIKAEYINKVDALFTHTGCANNCDKCRYNSNCIVGQCEYVRNNFRNIAAHPEPVDRETAVECCEKVITGMEARNRIDSVFGLIYDIVDKFIR